MTDFTRRLQQVAANPDALTHFGRGIEREALRISPQGNLSDQPHPEGLGQALTHDWITTDFAESLLEFITPVSTDIDTTLSQLSDIHKFTYSELGSEQLWPMSMPCFVENEAAITLAQYGQSNSGKMKTLYREGLKHRYGSVMQIISGVHFNFSFPEVFWEQLFGEQSDEARQESISGAYFGLIRNYYRYGWIIPYLFGASPALCGSFIKASASTLPFKEIGEGTCYLPYATSLRLSDLGYTNSAQSVLRIGFNSIEQYVDGLQAAIRTPSEEFAKIGVKVDGEYRQLNSNVLQIENELYSPIRPKRVAKSGEKPSDALQRGGVEYIEVRSLDVNPFSPEGIDADQIRFLDLFLTWATLTPSADMSDAELDCWRKNWSSVVVEGRDPELKLQMGCGEPQHGLQDLASDLFAQLRMIAEAIDAAKGGHAYVETCDKLSSWVTHPEMTLSARLLEAIKQKASISAVGYALAEQHAMNFDQADYQQFTYQQFVDKRHASFADQAAMEAADSVSFDQFLADYFADLH
ncbi:glutamate--cysteine ligase [Thaumasiovibrio subtropicus]|uniref:glutamate--cysteine ligase n=1 Tax=Thaumasiovibrio subtropicus TaxID=1891207 RepID=UPI000B354CD8|nr:glutamate--cysteine ligase [Thaumasiovibrio subtropicus]